MFHVGFKNYLKGKEKKILTGQNRNEGQVFQRVWDKMKKGQKRKEKTSEVNQPTGARHIHNW